MKRIFSTVWIFVIFVITVLLFYGCAGVISGPKYQPPTANLSLAVASFLKSKEVAISGDNSARGIIADAVLNAGGIPIERKKAEVEIKADIPKDSSSGGYNHGYSPVPLVSSGPAYRIKVEIWVSQNGAVRFHGVGAESYFDPGSISKTLATENATRYAL